MTTPRELKSPPPHRPSSSLEQPLRNPARPPRVLVADDDAEMRRLVCETLRKDHYDVEEEPDGGRLLVRVASLYSLAGPAEPIDLIVTDIRMPVCTGLDIVKGLRDARWATPVVLMTAFADAEVTRRAELLGATLFNKPFPMNELRAAVRDLLQ